MGVQMIDRVQIYWELLRQTTVDEDAYEFSNSKGTAVKEITSYEIEIEWKLLSNQLGAQTQTVVTLYK